MGVRTWRDLLPRGAEARALDFLRVNWHLGFTAFGGPPAHFKIFHDKFVKKEKWIDEQFFQELFSVSQALSGPASTKMLYCINLVHDGTLAAVIGFFIWSLPGAIAMYALSLGIASIQQTLPPAAYALLSGLNAAVVGVIALATVELSSKAITDPLTRFLVFFTASAGMLYNALWYFPVLMAVSGLATLVYDYRWLHRPIGAVMRRLVFWRRGRRDTGVEERELDSASAHTLGEAQDRVRGQEGSSPPHRSSADNQPPTNEASLSEPHLSQQHSTAELEPRIIPTSIRLSLSWRASILIIVAFFTSFLLIMLLRALLPAPTRLYSLFANMYLAGTIIFGGGPVVIPLLREYVVAEGWVSQRDFLIGLAIIQAFPGPNFNFAVFLGSLTAVNSGSVSAAGALIAWLGIFLPGMVLVHGTMGVWSSLRSRRWVKAVLRGINAGAVGLIYTAVYRIWQVGYVNEQAQQGKSLGDDPWWLVVSAASFVFGRWYGVSPPVTIVGGAVMGLVRYGVVRR